MTNGEDRDQPLELILARNLVSIQGLMLFAPFFDPEAEITVWGPPAAGRALRTRLARYISSPLSPIDIAELPARVTFRMSQQSSPGASARWR